jgi:hypothetical protein
MERLFVVDLPVSVVYIPAAVMTKTDEEAFVVILKMGEHTVGSLVAKKTRTEIRLHREVFTEEETENGD